MNIRRGLIRLWVFASAIWIAGVGTVAIYDPDIHRTGLSAGQASAAKWWEQDKLVATAPATGFDFRKLGAIPADEVEPAPATGFDPRLKPLSKIAPSGSQGAAKVPESDEWWKHDPRIKSLDEILTGTPTGPPAAAKPWDKEPDVTIAEPKPWDKEPDVTIAAPPAATEPAPFSAPPMRTARPTGPMPAQAAGTTARGVVASAIWKYVSVAFGVPIILLVLGAGVWWVAIGFKSDVPPPITETR